MTADPHGPKNRVFLVAGEASGDILGARLMDAIALMSDGAVRFEGIGGTLMRERGLESLFPMDELAVMGLAEVVPKIPNLRRRIRQTVTAILDDPPDAVVTIDAPGFCFRVAEKVAGRGIPLIHYVAPTVWAWRPGRARKIARFLDHLLALLPFEPPYFEEVGLPCTFVGHPVIETDRTAGDGSAFRDRHGIGAEVSLLCVMPGSRGSEVSRLLPIFAETVNRLTASNPALRIVVPTVETVADRVSEAVAGWAGGAVVVRDAREKWDAFAASDVALAASGTVALELALSSLPAVIAYRVSPVTAWIARRLVRVRYANLVNILLDDEIVPECIQANCTADRLESHVRRLLDDVDARQTQISRAETALTSLGLDGPPPSHRAARAVLDMMGFDDPKSK